MTITPATIAAFVRHLGSLGSMVIAGVGAGNLAGPLRVAMFVVGGAVQVVEHAKATGSSSGPIAKPPAV